MRRKSRFPRHRNCRKTGGRRYVYHLSTMEISERPVCPPDPPAPFFSRSCLLTPLASTFSYGPIYNVPPPARKSRISMARFRTGTVPHAELQDCGLIRIENRYKGVANTIV